MRQQTIKRRASVVHDDGDSYERVFGHSGHTECTMLDTDIDLDHTTHAHEGSSDRSRSEFSATHSRSDDDQASMKGSKQELTPGSVPDDCC